MELQIKVSGTAAQMAAQLADIAGRLQGATVAGPVTVAAPPAEETEKAGATAKAEPKKRGRKKGETKKAEAKPEPAPAADNGFGFGADDDEPAGGEVTFEEMQAAIQALSRRKKSAAMAIKIVGDIAGVKKVADIPAEHFAAIKSACEAAE